MPKKWRDEGWHEGPCAGGPLNGKKIRYCVKRVKIPLLIEGQSGIGSADYVWNDSVEMWIWEGGDHA